MIRKAKATLANLLSSFEAKVCLGQSVLENFSLLSLRLIP